MTYTVQATDYAGKPVQAELSLAVVDLSVLSLADPNSPPIVEGFYGERGLGIRTASTLVLSVDRLNVKLQTEVKGGGGGGRSEPASLRRANSSTTRRSGAPRLAPTRTARRRCKSCCRTT